jgi:Flp pilus assembly protein TadD
LAESLRKEAPLRVEALLLRSRVAMAAGDVVVAGQELEQALADSPNDLETIRLQCQFLFEHGTAGESEIALRRLIDRVPDDASARHNLGTLLLRSKRFKDATIAFREALQLRPDNLATHLHLGYALKGNGRIAEAASVF